MMEGSCPVFHSDRQTDTSLLHEEYQASLALRHTKGIGPRTWKGLLDHYGSAMVAIDHHNVWHKHGMATQAQVQAFAGQGWKAAAKREEAEVAKAGMASMMYSQKAYPERLREIPDPPIILYTLGDVSVMHRPCLAVVGSRQCLPYARRMAYRLCTELSRAGLTLVSGFAQGVDRIAHEVGFREQGASIAVLGTGLDIVYPASNRDIWEPVAASGLFLSEFSPGTLPKANHFPYRNRIISGLSLGVLVVQAARKSGSLITARLALEHNREVFAVPGPVGSGYEGSHVLIQSGAKLVQGLDDILEELEPFLKQQDRVDDTMIGEPQPSHASQPRLDEHQLQILRCLKEHGTLHIDTLTQLLGWESRKVSQALVMLEILHKVEQRTGMMYSMIP